MTVQVVTGTALLSAGAFVINTPIRMHHTTDANAVILLDASDGKNVTTLKVTDEQETDETWFPNGGFPCKDVHVTASAGSVYIYFE